MSQTIELRADHLHCQIKPELGGCVAGFWCGDVPVLRSTPAAQLESVRQAGSYPLVPFSNRVAQARLRWQGTQHPLVQNFAPEPHAIHGVGWQRPWQVLEKGPRTALLSYEHQPDAAWPFAFDSSQSFRLTAEGLEMSLSLTNQADQAAPGGLGWHPYFVKRARTRIAFEATGRWDMSDDKLPTQHRATHGLDGDCAFLDIDHCFDGWGGVVQLRDELLHTRISANLSRLVVYTNDRKDFIAIEPVSHVNNALNLLDAGAAGAQELGVCVLEPGESLSAHMLIAVARVS